MKKLMLGLCGSLKQDGSEQKVPTNYIDACRLAGLLPVIFPYKIDKADVSDYLDGLSGVLLCGGVDVEPKHYGEEPHEKLGETNPWRDALELLVIEEAMRRGMPILGICRGLQILNVYCKGSLIQDIPTQRASDIPHQGQKDCPAQHACEALKGTPAERWFAGEECSVNTYHHQCIKEPGSYLLPSVLAPDGVIEAFYSNVYPNLIAVQWHPEKDPNAISQRIFSDFASLCRSYEDKKNI